MDDQSPAPDQLSQKPPFNNLYLLSGLVHGFNRGWMYLFTILLLVFGYLSFQLTIMFPLMNRLKENGYSETDVINKPTLLFDSAALGIDRNILLVLELGMFVFAFLGFYIGLRRLHQKSLLSVLTGYSAFRYGRFWFSFALWGGLILLVTAYSYFTSPEHYLVTFEAQGFLISLVVLLLLMPIQTGIEELLFRGYMMQGLSQIFRNGIVPLMLSSLLFGFAHMSNPEVQQYGWPLMLTYYCSTALFFGAVTLLDEGIELAFGMHFANNMVSALLVTSPHSVLKTYSVLEARVEDPQTEIVIWLLMAIVTFIVLMVRYRWKNFNLVIR